MKPPRVYVDFNEMPLADEVLLSKDDSKVDSYGNVVTFAEGMAVAVYSDDYGDDGIKDNLIAEGVVQRNYHGGWTSAAKWVLKISQRGIRNESDESN